MRKAELIERIQDFDPEIIHSNMWEDYYDMTTVSEEGKMAWNKSIVAKKKVETLSTLHEQLTSLKVNEIEVKEPEIVKTPQQRFSEFKNKTDNLLKGGEKFNAKGRERFPFAMIEHIGINTYEELDSAMDLVATKKSNYSSGQRDAIQRAYVMCNIDFITKQED